ncbi:hypothetical protein EDC32_101177 [Laceyella sacchari]|jgi:Phage ABA sandwich domain|uniref:hypothetical protein n=1 Tax=Laceyella sacchari TaxID=37482 RepID=UPI001044B7E2|nr:hypothetical protein [Laceyella sacchari]TCW40535.1 hypothetical protein EDC32_101177 [Laceyella sacchari]
MRPVTVTRIIREEALALPPSRALDEYVGYLIMGYEESELRRVFLDEKKTTFKMTRWVKNGEPVYVPHFSTDVKDAFLLVETMRKEGWVFHFSSLADGYKATLQRSGTWGIERFECDPPYPKRFTLPEAITKVCIMAKSN